MPLLRRPDGVPAERVRLVRRFMPFLLRRRNESLVLFEPAAELPEDPERLR